MRAVSANNHLEGIYGPINEPGIEAVALARILTGNPNHKSYDCVDILRSMVEPCHPLRQGLKDFYS
jgi:hypothetical protein